MSNGETAAALQDRLGLTSPPIAIAFVSEQPAGVPRLDVTLPSACTMWRRAEQGVFFANATDHLNCTLGAYVMGFNLPEDKGKELMSEVGMMCEMSYFREEEVPYVPKMAEERAGVVYGPLSSFPLAPDAVLVWANPAQAMLLSDAAGLINWSSDPDDVLLGRPGCAAIPRSITKGRPSQSFGCVGMRLYTEAPVDQFLVALPGDGVEALAEQLFVTQQVHRQMRDHYLQRAQALTTR